MENSHKTSYKVRIADADRFGRLKAPALLQMLQEIATEHAEILGVAYNDLKPKNLGWALSKIAVEIERTPRWGERVRIETWASDRDRIATYREFAATDADGKSLFTARSQWLLFDVLARRIAKLDRLPDWPRNPAHANAVSFDEKFGKPDESAPNLSVRKFETLNDNIDLNGHVNNTVFAVWASETVPDSFAELRKPAKIFASFMEEVQPKSAVSVVGEVRGESTYVSIRSETGREHARVRIDWQMA